MGGSAVVDPLLCAVTAVIARGVGIWRRRAPPWHTRPPAAVLAAVPGGAVHCGARPCAPVSVPALVPVSSDTGPELRFALAAADAASFVSASCILVMEMDVTLAADLLPSKLSATLLLHACASCLSPLGPHAGSLGDRLRYFALGLAPASSAFSY